MTNDESTKYGLPWNYNFEIGKTIQRIKDKGAKCVALQFPEGLLMYSTLIADALEETGAEIVILGDVTYGACCVDDYAADALGCDFLVHYGHSCLISIKECCIPNMMYVFVEITIDVRHFVDTVKALISKDQQIACFATIQFVSAMRVAVDMLNSEHFGQEYPIIVPQNRPLSKGELLGCTSPRLSDIKGAEDINTVIYLGDGRFHLESFLIGNPKVTAYQYDPYKKSLSTEGYDHDEMHTMRKEAIEKAKTASSIGLIMGTLGRQGSSKIIDRIKALCRLRGKDVTLFLMSEIFPSKLCLIRDVDCFFQVACPRLSIDWGYAFDRPLLSPYEAEVALGQTQWKEIYPMDHYSKEGGKWAVYTDKSI